MTSLFLDFLYYLQKFLSQFSKKMWNLKNLNFKINVAPDFDGSTNTIRKDNLDLSTWIGQR